MLGVEYKNSRTTMINTGISARKLFLIDGIGALVSATCLLGILIPWKHLFSVPQHIIYVLAVIPILYAINSLLQYRRAPNEWRPKLKRIAYANFFYCGLTLILIIVLHNKISTLAIIYFLVEIVVIAGLSSLEIHIAHN